jgi:hypothetical protein
MIISNSKQIVRKSTPARRRANSSDNKAMEDLAAELYAVVRFALSDFGVTTAQQQRARARSLRSKIAPRASGSVLLEGHFLGEILVAWTREAEYLDADGLPRVLAIKGPGATFETLCRQFLPNKSLAEVVAMVCRHGEVITRPGGKIALLGGVLIDITQSPVTTLSQGVRHVRQVLQTVLNNSRVRRQGYGEWQMERLAASVIPRAAFSGLMKELRPQIDDLCQRIEALLQQRRPQTPRSLRSSTVASFGIYVSRDNDRARAGIDVRFPSARGPRRARRSELRD